MCKTLLVSPCYKHADGKEVCKSKPFPVGSLLLKDLLSINVNNEAVRNGGSVSMTTCKILLNRGNWPLCAFHTTETVTESTKAFVMF